MEHNYPNPFNLSTEIGYWLPFIGKISLKVYNILGQEVETLFESIRQAGHYEVTLDGSKLISGVYFYRLTANNFIE
jgi:hypothetical protein